MYKICNLKNCLLLFFIIMDFVYGNLSIFDDGKSKYNGRSKKYEKEYFALICTQEDRAKIAEIITALGTKGKIALLFNQSHYRRLGKDIEHVYPLKFLEVILTDKELKNYMRIFRKDYFKWSNFIGDFSKSLTNRVKDGSLVNFLPEFSKVVNVNVEKIKPFLSDKSDNRWEKMIDLLLSD